MSRAINSSSKRNIGIESERRITNLDKHGGRIFKARVELWGQQSEEMMNEESNFAKLFVLHYALSNKQSCLSVIKPFGGESLTIS